MATAWEKELSFSYRDPLREDALSVTGLLWLMEQLFTCLMKMTIQV